MCVCTYTYVHIYGGGAACDILVFPFVSVVWEVEAAEPLGPLERDQLDLEGNGVCEKYRPTKQLNLVTLGLQRRAGSYCVDP
jgi:hypothetical protein